MQNYINKKVTLLILFVLGMIIQTNAQFNQHFYQISGLEIANPERGWYDHTETWDKNYKPLSAKELINNREQDNITLILRLFYIEGFVEEDSISLEYRVKMQADFDSIRAAGIKCIVRFAYSNSTGSNAYDATPEKVFSHIASLKNVLYENADVIAGVQAGFIGVWGEWYYTNNFAQTNYWPNETDQENRRLLVEKLFEVLPENVIVQVRTPAIMRNIVETGDPISEAEAFNDSKMARVGHHNDCFMSDASDYGTYTDLDADIAYLHESTKYTITGGETCNGGNQYSNCDISEERMKELHWTYLNRDYNKDVYEKWNDQGCYNRINIALGYRLSLISSVLEDSVVPSEQLNIELKLINKGYAAPTQYKLINIVFTNTDNNTEEVLPYIGTNDDIRYWLPGNIYLQGHVDIPATMSDGNYSIGIEFSDQDINLAANPAYSIQLANAGIWNSERGVSNLNHIVVVGQGGQGYLPSIPLGLNATQLSETEIHISWTPSDEVVLKYEIMRSEGEANEWVIVAELGPDETEFVDQEVEREHNYKYIIRSGNQFGYSGWSDVVSLSTQSSISLSSNNNESILYPNPLTNDDLVIQFQNTNEKIITVTNLSGQVLSRQKTNEMQCYVKRSVFEKGIFIVTIQQVNKIESKRIIVF